MSSTLLQLVQQAAGEMGLAVPSTVISNTNTDVVQLRYLLNSVGYSLLRKHEWQALNKLNLFQSAYLSTTGTVASGSAVITAIPSTTGLSARYQVTGNGILQNSNILTVDSATQVTLDRECNAAGTAQAITFSQTEYAMPTDYDRQINKTHYDSTQHWAMIGPETAQQWEWLTSGYISSGPRVRYRIFGDYFQIWPPQGSEHYLGFEYVSNYWAATAAAVAKGSFTVDTDTCIFPDRLMVVGLKNAYYGAKGLGDMYQKEYDMQESIAFANDAGAPTLSMVPRPSEVLIGIDNLPDSGFGT